MTKKNCDPGDHENCDGRGVNLGRELLLSRFVSVQLVVDRV